MKKEYKLGVVGGGFMAKAIVDGVIGKKCLLPEQIILSEPSEEKRRYFSERGVSAVYDNPSVAEKSEFVLLCVKPQMFGEVSQSLRGAEKIITIMAGKTKESVRNALGKEVKIARAMPNLPCSVGAGMVGLDCSEFDGEDKTFVLKLFSSTGEVVETAEEQLNAVTGVSGSGPAYVYLFLKSLAEAGVKAGLKEEQAYKMALQTLKGGIAHVEANPDKSLSELIAAVSSKGGTTVAALSEFEKGGFSQTIEKGVMAAVERAAQLSK